jgi:PHD/YefM family antitoxin component YafN of YafNO toxin-antitoxin module
MTESFNLDFHGTQFTVPKLNLFNLFEHQRDLFDATSYEVQSSVPLGIFELFVKALGTGEKVSVTKENAGAVSLLAKEFWLDDLLSECSALQMASLPELVAALSERISKLEHQLSSHPLALLAELKESVADHERQLTILDRRISGLDPNLMTELTALKSGSVAPISTPSPLGSAQFRLFLHLRFQFQFRLCAFPHRLQFRLFVPQKKKKTKMKAQVKAQTQATTKTKKASPSCKSRFRLGRTNP